MVTMASIAGAAEEPPVLVVNGPTTATPGEILTFDFSQTTGTSVRYRVTISPTLKGYKQVYHDSATTPRANIASFPGRYTLRIQAWNADGFDEFERVITVPGNPPCPPPEPAPPPEPVPVPIPEPAPPAPQPVPTPPSPKPLPDTMGVSAQVQAAARSVGDPSGCRALADKADALARTIRKGEETSAQAVITQIAAAIKAAGPRWTPFLTSTKAVIQALVMAGKLDTADLATLATFLEEIAAALRAAAG